MFLKWKLAGALVVFITLLSGAVFAVGWSKGGTSVQAKWDKERQENELAASQQVQQQAVATVIEVVKYVDRIKVVQGKTETIIKEVPKYVTVQADADCIINNGFVRLHDHAAANTIPDGPRDTDAAPSGIELSTIAEAVAGNYGIAHENAAQLVALQDWIRAMEKVDGR